MERFWRKHLYLRKGETVRYRFLRDGEEVEVRVTAGKRPLEAVRFFLQVELSSDAGAEPAKRYRHFVAKKTGA